MRPIVEQNMTTSTVHRKTVAAIVVSAVALALTASTWAEATFVALPSKEKAKSGQTVTLKWAAPDATRLFLSGIGEVDKSGIKSVKVQNHATYTLVFETKEGLVSTAFVRVAVDDARGFEDQLPHFDAFTSPVTKTVQSVPLTKFLDHVHATLQDKLRYSVSFEQISNEFVFRTPYVERTDLVAPSETAIVGRRLAYLVEVDKPVAATAALSYSVKTALQYRRRLERVWRPDSDSTRARGQVDALVTLLQMLQ